MTRRTALGAAAALAAGWALRIPPFFLGTGTGEPPIAGAVIGFCVTVSSFFAPVLLNVVWWGTLGVLAFAFGLHHRRAPAPPPSGGPLFGDPPAR